LLQATNRLAEAEPLMRRALEIDERSLGADHPGVAIHLNNLAQLLQDTDRLAEAEPLMRRALEIDERGLGADHPGVAIHLNNLAQLLQATNRLAEAEPLMRRALEILVGFQQRTGHEHPNLDVVRSNFKSLLDAMGRSTNQLEESSCASIAPAAADDSGPTTWPEDRGNSRADRARRGWRWLLNRWIVRLHRSIADRIIRPRW
jgi:tetratricopeptide (TPR) repeat protein